MITDRLFFYAKLKTYFMNLLNPFKNESNFLVPDKAPTSANPNKSWKIIDKLWFKSGPDMVK